MELRKVFANSVKLGPSIEGPPLNSPDIYFTRVIGCLQYTRAFGPSNWDHHTLRPRGKKFGGRLPEIAELQTSTVVLLWYQNLL